MKNLLLNIIHKLRNASLKISMTARVSSNTKFGKQCRVQHASIYHSVFGDGIEVGKNTIISSSKVGSHCKIYGNVTLYSTEVGRHSFISDQSNIHNTSTGPFCSIASNVAIGLGKHPVDYISSSPVFYSTRGQAGKFFAKQTSFKENEPVKIGADVWIGAGAIINDGITIGHGAIIGAGAVVVKDVAPYEIVGGVPAKRIRLRFDEAIIEQLLASKWWEKEDDVLQKNAAYFQAPMQNIDVEAFSNDLNRK